MTHAPIFRVPGYQDIHYSCATLNLWYSGDIHYMSATLVPVLGRGKCPLYPVLGRDKLAVSPLFPGKAGRAAGSLVSVGLSGECELCPCSRSERTIVGLLGTDVEREDGRRLGQPCSDGPAGHHPVPAVPVPAAGGTRPRTGQDRTGQDRRARRPPSCSSSPSPSCRRLCTRPRTGQGGQHRVGSATGPVSWWILQRLSWSAYWTSWTATDSYPR